MRYFRPSRYYYSFLLSWIFRGAEFVRENFGAKRVGLEEREGKEKGFYFFFFFFFFFSAAQRIVTETVEDRYEYVSAILSMM